MIFKNVNTLESAPDILFDLLKERTQEQSISHKKMPSMREHLDFIDSNPYSIWCLCFTDEDDICIGSIYLTRSKEVGLFIFKEHQGKGYGKRIFKEFIDKFSSYPVLANINPENEQALGFWKSLGGKTLQFTYLIDSGSEDDEVENGGV